MALNYYEKLKKSTSHLDTQSVLIILALGFFFGFVIGNRDKTTDPTKKHGRDKIYYNGQVYDIKFQILDIHDDDREQKSPSDPRY